MTLFIQNNVIYVQFRGFQPESHTYVPIGQSGTHECDPNCDDVSFLYDSSLTVIVLTTYLRSTDLPVVLSQDWRSITGSKHNHNKHIFVIFANEPPRHRRHLSKKSALIANALTGPLCCGTESMPNAGRVGKDPAIQKPSTKIPTRIP